MINKNLLPRPVAIFATDTYLKYSLQVKNIAPYSRITPDTNKTLEKSGILGYFLSIWRLKYRLYLLLSELIQSTLPTCGPGFPWLRLPPPTKRKRLFSRILQNALTIPIPHTRNSYSLSSFFTFLFSRKTSINSVKDKSKIIKKRTAFSISPPSCVYNSIFKTTFRQSIRIS